MQQPLHDDTTHAQQLEDAILSFAGSFQLSLNEISSEAFTEFIRSVSTISVNHYLTNHASPETLYKGLSRQTIRQKMINKGKTEKRLKLKNMRLTSKYVSICVDAGSVERKDLLQFIISNPSAVTKTVLLKTFIFEDHTSSSFYNFLQKSIQTANKYDFDVVAVLADNVAYQKKCLAHWDPDSLINQSDDYRLNILFYITCNCNNLDLVVKFLINNNKIFMDVALFSTVLATLSLKRRFSQYFTNRPPRVPATRWMYLYFFTKYVIDNADDINRFISMLRNFKDPTLPSNTIELIKTIRKNKSFSIQNCKQIYLIMHHLKELCDSLESDSCPLGSVVPLVESCLKSLQKLYDEEIFTQNKDLITETIQVLAARFRKTVISDYLCLAYALTAAGRCHLGLPQDYPIDEKIKEEHDSYNYYSQNKYNRSDEFIPPTEKVKYYKEFQKVFMSKVKDKPKKNEFQDELNRIKNEDIIEIFPKPSIQALSALISFLIRMGYSEKQINLIKNEFNDFIYLRTQEIIKDMSVNKDANTYNVGRT